MHECYTHKKLKIKLLEFKSSVTNILIQINCKEKIGPERPSTENFAEPLKKRARVACLEEVWLDGIGNYPNKK